MQERSDVSPGRGHHVHVAESELPFQQARKGQATFECDGAILESLGHFYLALTAGLTNSLHRGTPDTGQLEREEHFGQRSTSARPEVASDISTRGVFLRPILASDILARFL
jgi:hypothetical protein